MSIMKSIKISPQGNPDSVIEFSYWEGEEDVLHMEFPKNAKLHVSQNGEIQYIQLPDESRIYVRLEHLERIVP